MSALEIATDLYRTTMDCDCKERDKILNGRSRRESSMHLIKCVKWKCWAIIGIRLKAFLCRCVSLGLNERFQSVDSYPMSKCGTGCSVHFIVTGNLRAAWIHSFSSSLILINNNKRIDVFPFARTLQNIWVLSDSWGTNLRLLNYFWWGEHEGIYKRWREDE